MVSIYPRAKFAAFTLALAARLLGAILLPGTTALAHTAGVSSELLTCDDITLNHTEAFARWTDYGREITLAGGPATTALDYLPAPTDLIGVPVHRSDTRHDLLLSWRETLSSDWQASASVGGYSGYTDYRSLWIDEYYRQLFAPVPGYQRADPHGLNASLGGSYEYLPASGRLTWSLGWQYDQVSPGYEKLIGGPLVRGRDQLDTVRLTVGSEHVLNPRLRVRQDLSFINTTARDGRQGYGAEAACALAEHWTARLRLEGVKESEFHSASAALLLEYDWSARWFAGLSLRLYRDNGQLTDPTLVSSGAPALDTRQLQASFRYAGPRLSGRLAVGPYQTRYASLSTGSAQFATLYQDRDWLALQTALAWTF